MKNLSKLTIALGAYIIISASFMRQLNELLTQTLGTEAIKISFLYIFSILMMFYVFYVSYKKIPLYKIVSSFAIFVIAYILMMMQPFFAEKLHVIEYGLLGFLAVKDFLKVDKKILKGIAMALVFALLVSVLDEGLQAILPYRVFDVRDIVTNIVSGSLGVILFLIK